MKQPFNGLQARLRDRWYLHQARRVIARCERSVARRQRIGVPVQRRPRGPYFAPGVIDVQLPRHSPGLRAFAATVGIALASVAILLALGGLPS